MDRCFLCKSKKKDDIQYGEFLSNKHYGVHTFCLYLSSNLSQNGEDDEGLLGFLDADIRKEEKRISQLKCFYCRGMYANIGCCERKCRKTFHLICGLNNYCENQFCNDFRSYCHRHVRKIQQRPSATETCLICYENLCAPAKIFKSVTMILTPCCRNGWFHKFCLQKFAKTAGYFFKCPLCNDTDIFRKKLPARGIFIPNQDAAWELEPNAFAELLERPSVCSASECKNRRGPTYESDHNPFLMCRACGSKAMHKHCLQPGLTSFYCNDCTLALEEGDSGRESLNSQKNNNGGDEDDDVDVCHVSDKEDLEIVKLIDAVSSQQDSDTNNEKLTQPCSSRRRRISSSDLELSDIKQNKESETKLESNERQKDIRLESQTDDKTKESLPQYSDTESNEDLLVAKTNRKRRCLIILSDSDDKEQHSSAKQTRFNSVNNDKIEESDEDDDDPLENFYEVLQKQENIASRARRTCKKTQREDNEDKYKNKNSSFQSKNNEDKALEISCIAKRTRRRKTMHSTEGQRTNLQDCKEANTQHRLDVSCIAVRTRRRTICAQTAKEYLKQGHNEMSQIYEKADTTEDESETNATTMDDESESDTETTTITTTDIDDFIVDDGYEEKDSNFEISCIANRTRRRKSLRTLRTQTILEENESEDDNDMSSSSTSATSSSTQTAVSLSNLRTPGVKRCKQRILSTSSEESNTDSHKHSNYRTRFLEKMPAINLNNYLKPNYGSLNKYSLSHSHHTRKRL